jgi:hypothetical protein
MPMHLTRIMLALKLNLACGRVIGGASYLHLRNAAGLSRMLR